METPESFIARYRTVFERFSAVEIADQFAFPLQVTGDNGAGVVLVVATSKEQWTQQLEGLLASYRKIGVAKSEVKALEAVTISPNLAQARVHWALFTDDGQPIYEFHSVYTLGLFDSGLRIIAIAHDELIQLRAAVSKAV